MSLPSILDKIVEDEYGGSAPFIISYYTDESARKYTVANSHEERITNFGQPTGESLRPLKRQDRSSMVVCETLKLADPNCSGRKHYNMQVPLAEAYLRLCRVD